MTAPIALYIVRDDLLVIVPPNDEQVSGIRRILPDWPGVHFLVMAPGTTVTDLRRLAEKQPTVDPGRIPSEAER